MTQIARGTIALRERIFRVNRASVTRHEGSWSIEIETDGEEFDHETWAPYLYHQGLAVDATVFEDLRGRTIRWRSSSGPTYSHPEIGAMYVFGHHDVRECEITFGEVTSGEIELSWTGLCDVFWSGDFMNDVPFRCKCVATLRT